MQITRSERRAIFAFRRCLSGAALFRFDWRLELLLIRSRKCAGFVYRSDWRLNGKKPAGIGHTFNSMKELWQAGINRSWIN